MKINMEMIKGIFKKPYVWAATATICFAIMLIFFLCGYEFSRFNIFFFLVGATAGNFNAFISEYGKDK